MSLLLTSEQITAGAAGLSSGKLTASAVADLLSIFRGYLGDLESDYSIQSTLEAQDDSADLSQKCAKLMACLALWSDNQFTPEIAGFAPTAANRTGFVYALSGENFEIFKYAFGLFWSLPKSLSQSGSSSRVSTQGTFRRTNP